MLQQINAYIFVNLFLEPSTSLICVYKTRFFIPFLLTPYNLVNTGVAKLFT